MKKNNTLDKSNIAQSNQGNTGKFAPELVSLIIDTSKKVAIIGKIRKRVKPGDMIPSTQDEIRMIGEDYVIQGQEITAVSTESKHWTFIDSNTREEVGLKIKGTKKKIYIIEKKFQLGEKNIYEARLMDEDSDNIWVNLDTLEEIQLKVKGTNKLIYEIRKEHTISGIKVCNIVTTRNQNIIINSDTLEEVKLTVKGTKKQIIYVLEEEQIIGNRKVQRVITQGNKQIWINPDTLEEVKLNIKGKESQIITINNSIVIGDTELLQVEIIDKKWRAIRDGEKTSIYVNPNTLEPLLFEGKYITNIRKLENGKFTFNLNNWGDYYEMQI